MICRLCLEDKKLIQSHILPKSFFRYLYPTGKIGGESLLLVDGDSGKYKKSRTGPYDENILCYECDSKIGVYDDYAKRIFIDENVTIHPELAGLYYIHNINYSKLKLFFLSLLWRASISSLTIFAKINAGPFKNILREMIINGDPGGIQDFSVILTKFDLGNLPDGINKNIQDPYREKIDGVNFTDFYLPKFYKIYIKVDKRDLPLEYKKIALQDQDDALILRRGNYSGSQEFKMLSDIVAKI